MGHKGQKSFQFLIENKTSLWFLWPKDTYFVRPASLKALKVSKNKMEHLVVTVVVTFLGKPLYSLQGEAPNLNPSLLNRGSIWVPHPVHPPMEGATLDRKS